MTIITLNYNENRETIMNTITDYKIYLVNKGVKAKTFWCFLDTPHGLLGEKVYANSSTMLSVPPNYQGTNTFTVPIQYKVAAGADNKALGLNTKINSLITIDAELEKTYTAIYANSKRVPPSGSPLLTLAQNVDSPEKTIGILSNVFDQGKNHDEKHFSHMSFGIQTEQGFTGITWDPSPNNEYTITPKIKFYIATGNFTSETLADINDISRTSATVALTDFENLEATVTLRSDGRWNVTKGAPKPPLPPYS